MGIVCPYPFFLWQLLIFTEFKNGFRLAHHGMTEMERGAKQAGVKKIRVHDDRVIIGASQKKPSKIKGLQMILSYYFLQYYNKS